MNREREREGEERKERTRQGVPVFTTVQHSRWTATVVIVCCRFVLFCLFAWGGGGGGVSPFNLTSSSLTTSSNAMPNLSFVDGNCQYPIQGIHTARTFVWCGVCKLPCLHQTLTG